MKNRSLMVAALVLTAMLVYPDQAGAQIQMFLKVEGIDGESVVRGHEREIEVSAWSWGITNTTTTGVSAGGGAGRADFEPLVIRKFIDKASPNLFLAASTGTYIPEVVLTTTKSGPDGPQDFFKLILKKVVVVSVAPNGISGEGPLYETIMLGYAQVTWEYRPQKQDGSLDAAIRSGFDLEKQEPL